MTHLGAGIEDLHDPLWGAVPLLKVRKLLPVAVAVGIPNKQKLQLHNVAEQSRDT